MSLFVFPELNEKSFFLPAIMIEEKILREYRTVAVVGLSPDPSRPSPRVATYLSSHSYKVISVNPDAQEILGTRSYPDMSSIPESVEIVDIFRRSEEVMPIVDEAIKIGARRCGCRKGLLMRKRHLGLEAPAYW